MTVTTEPGPLTRRCVTRQLAGTSARAITDGATGTGCLSSFERRHNVAVRPWLEALRTRLQNNRGRRSSETVRRLGTHREIQNLEDRTLLASTVLLAGSELKVLSDADESIIVQEDPANSEHIEVLVNGSPSTAVGVLRADAITALTVLTGDEDNSVDLTDVDAAVFMNLTTITVATGNGDDTIVGSPDIAMTVDAGDGDDTITAFAGLDTLRGGDGDDSILGGDGADSIDAGNGDDIVSGEAGDDTILADDGNDTISGGADNDSIVGHDGDDLLNGDGGTDTIFADLGDDIVDGGAGTDLIFGGAGRDTIDGNTGNDTIFGNGGVDSLQGGDDDDSIRGGTSNDVVSGGAGNDILLGDLGDDTVAGEADDDSIYGGSGSDSLFGDGTGNISGEFGNDLIFGQAGNDTILGGPGSDDLNGGIGNDVVQSGDLEAGVPPQLVINDAFSGNESDADNILFGGASNIPSGLGFADDVELADMDGDGDLDIVALDFNEVSVILNQGGGAFGAAQTFPVGVTFAQDLAVGDFTGDGIPDVAVDGATLINNGDGTLGTPSVVAQSFFFDEVALGDFNGDGLLDYAQADNNGREIEPFLNAGGGSFSAIAPTPQLAFFADINDFVAVDLNGDGRADLAAAVDEAFTTDYLAVWLNNGSGAFGPATQFTAGVNPQEIRSGDIDGDGDIDLITYNTTSDDVSVFLNNGVGSFSLVQTVPFTGLSFFSDAINLADYDADGDLDIGVVGNNSTINIAVNDGFGNFGTPLSFPNGQFFDPDDGMASGDIDGDGDVDIVAVGNFSNISLFLNSPIPAPVLTFNVTLSQPATSTVTVQFQTVDGTAVSGVDYLPESGTLTFLPGEQLQVVEVTAIGDTLAEGDETFFVQLSNPVNAAITDGQAQGLINDDDGGASGPTVSIDNVSMQEGDTGLTSYDFTVSLSQNPTGPVTVDFSVDDGTAINGFDFTAQTGTLMFMPGTTSQTITVDVFGDMRAEGDEQFFVNLSNPIGATLLDSRGVGEIINDDGSAVLSDDTLRGGDGDDTLLGSIGNDFAVGDLGNDSIEGSLGADTLYGGGGNDTINGGDGDDSLFGQGGFDVLDGGTGEDDLIWRGASDARDTVTGGIGGDLVEIRGTSSSNIFTVGQTTDGRLTVEEGAAVLTVDFDVKNIAINAGNGDDSISVGDISSVVLSTLTINGDAGADTITAAASTPGSLRLVMNGGVGEDSIFGGSGNETISGGEDDDVLSGGGGNDLISGDAGADMIGGEDGNDTISGGDGNDAITGGNGDDSVSAGNDNDTVDGGAGDDTIRGQFGDDNLIGSFGNDSIDGGLGADNVIGGAGNDRLDGGRNDDVVIGNSGDDTILGNHGNDFIRGNGGADEIVAGDGDDTVFAGDGADGVDAGDGDDQVFGDNDSDTIIGGDGDDTLSGGGAQDTILGQEGDDVINGNGGSDLAALGEGNVINLVPLNIEVINELFVLSDEMLENLDGV